jgi:hypothetical protein
MLTFPVTMDAQILFRPGKQDLVQAIYLTEARVRKLLYATTAVAMACAGLGAAIPAASAAAGHPGITITSVPPSLKDPRNRHAGQPGANPRDVPVSGDICGGAFGGNCWWETAVQFWYDMKQGDNEASNLAGVYDEYTDEGHGSFEDGWTDDNAWWGITWELAYQEYGVSAYDTLAHNLWTWDTTPGEGWDTACGGSTIQHAGGAEDTISRAALGVLASSIGDSGSASRAAAWIFQYMQGSNEDSPAAEDLNPGTCTATGTAQLGGQTESWKVEQLTGGSGQTGTRAYATAQYPDSDYSGVFNLLYQQYIG